MTEKQVSKIFEMIHDKYYLKMLIVTSDRLIFRWHDGTIKSFSSNFDGIMEAINWIEYAKAEEEVVSKALDVREIFYS